MKDQPAALVDTDVFGLLYVYRNPADQRVPGWLTLLAGTRVFISFQTRSEALAGALADNWGPRRMAQLRSILDSIPTVGAESGVIEAHAALYSQCRKQGHALHARQHTGDRWVAACAIARDFPLLAGDGIYRNTPGLRLLAEGDDD